MSWLLTVLMILADGSAVVTEMGLMNGRDICRVTGAAIELRLKIETPAVRVIWTCVDSGAMS